MSTTTTEISSNSNSSCRLLLCLNTLPSHDQCVFRSLLGHIELLRLSACCRSLRSSIRNDKALWQERYHRDFLSGAYYVKEMEFVLWCVRTDVNNPCTSDKRADLLENVDWYNTYRRRVSTKNNWRYGRYKTTHIDMKSDKNGVCYAIEAEYNSLVIIQQNRPDETPDHSYILEYLPHSNLRSSNNTVYNSTLSTSPNVLLLDSGNATQDDYVAGDHYIAVRPDVFESDTDFNVKILTRKHGGIFTTFDVPVQYRLDTIEGKWALLVYERDGLFHDSPVCIPGIMVFDIDNSIMCPGSIDDTWNATCFYKTTNNTAIVYTARLVEDDDVGRIEWALYQFSSNNPVVQLRNGWFQLPERIRAVSIFAQNSYDSHMLIEILDSVRSDLSIIHNIASDGQSHTPRNCYTISKQHMPIPLLKAGCRYSMFDFRPTKVWTDLFYNDDQVLQIPGTVSIRNLIGDLYIFITRNHDRIERRLLVDINRKEIIRRLDVPNTDMHFNDFAMLGTIGSSRDSDAPILQEYGEL